MTWILTWHLSPSLALVIADLSWATFSKQKSLPAKDSDSPASLWLPPSLPFRSPIPQAQPYVLLGLGSSFLKPSFGAEWQTRVGSDGREMFPSENGLRFTTAFISINGDDANQAEVLQRQVRKVKGSNQLLIISLLMPCHGLSYS